MATTNKLTIYDDSGNPTTYDIKDTVSGYSTFSGRYNDLDGRPDLGTQVTYSLSGTTLTITTK